MSDDPTDARERSEGLAGLPITRDELRMLSTPRPWLVLGKTALFFALWAVLAWVAWRLPSWWMRLPVWVALGLVVNGLVQLGHDAWHQTLFKTRWHNALYGHVFSVFFGVSYVAARHAHLRHHWYNRTARDPDAYNAGAGVGVWVQFYLVVVAGLLLAPLHFNLLYPLSAFSRRDWGPHLVTFAAYALVYTALLVGVVVPHHAWDVLFAFWFVPLVCATPFNGLKSIADHYANTWEGDRFHTATTVTTAPWLTWLWNGLNHHLDHHLFPRVPGHALGALHAKLRPALLVRGAPVFDGYPRVFWRAFVAGPTYLDAASPFLKER